MNNRKRKGTELQITLETAKSLKHAPVDASKFQFGENTHSETKRTRASIICDGCKGSKKKCEGWDQNTRCRTCIRKGIECILPPHCTSCRRKKLDNTGICSECKNEERNLENRDYAINQQIQALEERVRLLEVNLEKFQILEANLEKFQTLETTINKLATQQFDKSPKDHNNVNNLDGENIMPDLSKHFTFEV
ncbi:4070_t:CDS:2 [Gigaspora margarita]|uniref:4070_t:CDS:1 n=1 Tax=Gigaspora margarita TaxID=4874 RepID=A0ABM8W0P4_GIGMA|nr:4070_t:CDS:2 [Gigaspora margarita]